MTYAIVYLVVAWLVASALYAYEDDKSALYAYEDDKCAKYVFLAIILGLLWPLIAVVLIVCFPYFMCKWIQHRITK